MPADSSKSDATAMDYALARAAQLALEAESAFGIDQLPRGERIEITGMKPSVGSEAETATVEAAATPEPEPKLAGGKSPRTLDQIAEQVAACEACVLCSTRNRTVPGQGNPKARLMFIGEAPGADEDASGQAFVGQAGQLLTKMIGAMGLSREDVFIANILKCRPPGNRNPKPEEATACFHFLLDQIESIGPEVICALGSHAANNLLERSEPIGRLRGRIFDFQGAKLVPTYHPAYLLREPGKKRAAWEDLQQIMSILGLEKG